MQVIPPVIEKVIEKVIPPVITEYSQDQFSEQYGKIIDEADKEVNELYSHEGLNPPWGAGSYFPPKPRAKNYTSNLLIPAQVFKKKFLKTHTRYVNQMKDTYMAIKNIHIKIRIAGNPPSLKTIQCEETFWFYITFDKESVVEQYFFDLEIKSERYVKNYEKNLKKRIYDENFTNKRYDQKRIDEYYCFLQNIIQQGSQQKVVCRKQPAELKKKIKQYKIKGYALKFVDNFYNMIIQKYKFKHISGIKNIFEFYLLDFFENEIGFITDEKNMNFKFWYNIRGKSLEIHERFLVAIIRFIVVDFFHWFEAFKWIKGYFIGAAYPTSIFNFLNPISCNDIKDAQTNTVIYFKKISERLDNLKSFFYTTVEDLKDRFRKQIIKIVCDKCPNITNLENMLKQKKYDDQIKILIEGAVSNIFSKYKNIPDLLKNLENRKNQFLGTYNFTTDPITKDLLKKFTVDVDVFKFIQRTFQKLKNEIVKLSNRFKQIGNLTNFYVNFSTTYNQDALFMFPIYHTNNKLVYVYFFKEKKDDNKPFSYYFRDDTYKLAQDIIVGFEAWFKLNSGSIEKEQAILFYYNLIVNDQKIDFYQSWTNFKNITNVNELVTDYNKFLNNYDKETSVLNSHFLVKKLKLVPNDNIYQVLDLYQKTPTIFYRSFLNYTENRIDDKPKLLIYYEYDFFDINKKNYIKNYEQEFKENLETLFNNCKLELSDKPKIIYYQNQEERTGNFDPLKYSDLLTLYNRIYENFKYEYTLNETEKYVNILSSLFIFKHIENETIVKTGEIINWNYFKNVMENDAKNFRETYEYGISLSKYLETHDVYGFKGNLQNLKFVSIIPDIFKDFPVHLYYIEIYLNEKVYSTKLDKFQQITRHLDFEDFIFFFIRTNNIILVFDLTSKPGKRYLYNQLQIFDKFKQHLWRFLEEMESYNYIWNEIYYEIDKVDKNIPKVYSQLLRQSDFFSINDLMKNHLDLHKKFARCQKHFLAQKKYFEETNYFRSLPNIDYKIFLYTIPFEPFAIVPSVNRIGVDIHTYYKLDQIERDIDMQNKMEDESVFNPTALNKFNQNLGQKLGLQIKDNLKKLIEINRKRIFQNRRKNGTLFSEIFEAQKNIFEKLQNANVLNSHKYKKFDILEIYNKIKSYINNIKIMIKKDTTLKNAHLGLYFKKELYDFGSYEFKKIEDKSTYIHQDTVIALFTYEGNLYSFHNKFARDAIEKMNTMVLSQLQGVGGGFGRKIVDTDGLVFQPLEIDKNKMHDEGEEEKGGIIFEKGLNWIRLNNKMIKFLGTDIYVWFALYFNFIRKMKSGNVRHDDSRKQLEQWLKNMKAVVQSIEHFMPLMGRKKLRDEFLGKFNDKHITELVEDPTYGNGFVKLYKNLKGANYPLSLKTMKTTYEKFYKNYENMKDEFERYARV